MAAASLPACGPRSGRQPTTATDYISGIQYKNNGAAIDFIQTEEGKVVQVSPGVYDYYYYLGDHLGNTRVTFDTQSGTATMLQQDDYYPFGMEINRNVNETKMSTFTIKRNYRKNLGNTIMARGSMIRSLEGGIRLTH